MSCKLVVLNLRNLEGELLEHEEIEDTFNLFIATTQCIFNKAAASKQEAPTNATSVN